MKKKVWIVSWYGEMAGGLERIVCIIKKSLEEDYEVKIIDIPYIIKHGKYNLLMRSKNRVVLMIAFSAFIWKNVAKEDIVITHGQNAPFVKSDYLFDHGSIMSLKREMKEFVYGGSSVFEWIAVKKAKMNIAVSAWTKEQIMKNYHVKEKNICVLNNCVETDLFYPIERKRTEQVSILFCGRLEPAKGLELLLKIAAVVEKSSQYKLKIAANDERNVQLFMNRTNIEVKFSVPIKKMNDFYNSGDVLFVPSKCEGFGMSIIESLAAGVPVITNRVGIVDELLQNECIGLELLDESKKTEEIMQDISKLAREFQNVEKKYLMHSYIDANYGFPEYKKRLSEIVGERSYAAGKHYHSNI